MTPLIDAALAVLAIAALTMLATAIVRANRTTIPEGDPDLEVLRASRNGCIIIALMGLAVIAAILIFGLAGAVTGGY